MCCSCYNNGVKRMNLSTKAAKAFFKRESVTRVKPLPHRRRGVQEHAGAPWWCSRSNLRWGSRWQSPSKFWDNTELRQLAWCRQLSFSGIGQVLNRYKNHNLTTFLIALPRITGAFYNAAKILLEQLWWKVFIVRARNAKKWFEYFWDITN